MSLRTTQKELYRAYGKDNILMVCDEIRCGMFNDKRIEKRYTTDGVYGWNASLFEFRDDSGGYSRYVCAGNRPFGSRRIMDVSWRIAEKWRDAKTDAEKDAVYKEFLDLVWGE